MKIACVLAILSTLYVQGSTLNCKTTADWADASSLAFTDEDCTAGGATTCVRPIFLAGGQYQVADGEAVKWGCGVCTTAASCVSCAGELCNVEPTFKCKTDKIGTDGVNACPDQQRGNVGTFLVEDTCVRPLMILENEYSTANPDWGCGICTDESQCKTCTTSSGCNVAPTPFTCLKYLKGDTTWAKVADTKVNCYEELINAVKCQMPTPDAAGNKDDVLGCGFCKKEGDNTCKDCDSADCNDLATSKYCKVGGSETEKDNVATLPSNFCDADNSKCKRPTVEYSAVIDAAEGYACAADCDDAGKCKLCDTSDCNNAWPSTSHKCYSWAFADSKWTFGAEAECVSGDGEAKCNMPKDMAVEAGFTSKTGCGPCNDDEAEACVETAAGANGDPSHQCFKWTWNTVDKKWKQSAAVGDCWTSTKKCSLPKDRSKEAGYTSDGCGVCKTAEKDACVESEEKMNVGQKAVISLLVTLLPLLYVML